MILRRLFASLALTLLCLPYFVGMAFAAGESVVIEAEEPVLPVPAIEIQINSVDEVKVERKLILDATGSVPASEVTNYTFEWDFGDGMRDFGPEVVHQYAEPGEYEVVLRVSNDKDEATLAKNIFVYNNNILLVSDGSADQALIASVMEDAHKQFTFVSHFASRGGVSEFLIEQELFQYLFESQRRIEDADVIVFWTEGTLSATLLSELNNALPSQVLDFSSKDILFVVKHSLSGFENIAAGTYDNVRPNRIVLTYREGLNRLVEAMDLRPAEDGTFVERDFVGILQDKAVNHEVIAQESEFSIFRFMSYFINYMINHGVPSNTIKLVLMLPVIVTVIAFMKQVVGFDTLGVYTPSMLAISLIALDIWFGLFILIAILLTSLLTRRALKKYRMMYIPRMSILLIVFSILILGLLIFATYFNISQIIAISIFPMFLLGAAVERFTSLVSEKGLKTASQIMLEVIVVAVVCYFVADHPFVRTVMLAYPELVFLLVLVNGFLGRWTGLRIFEYIRFREVFKHYAEE